MNEEELSKIEFALGFADSDEKFERAANSYLVVILEQMATTDMARRARVMKLLGHLNQRIKTSKAQLPVISLVNLLSSTTSQMVINFALIYIKPALERCAVDDLEKSLPLLVTNLSSRSENQINSISNHLLSVLHRIPDSLDRKLLSGVPNSDISCVFDKFQLVMFYSVPPLKDPKLIPPGMSENQVNSLVGTPKSSWAESSEQLQQLKIQILKLLMRNTLVDTSEFEQEKFKIYLISSAEANTFVSPLAEDALKRYVTASLESVKLANDLYDIYLGTTDKVPTSLALKTRYYRI